MNKEHNFNINDLISNFTLDDFIGRGKKLGLYNNSAVLLITNKQYILSWTNNFGMGFHYEILAQIYKYITEGSPIKNSLEEFKLERKVSKYMHAKLFYLNGSGKMVFYSLESLNYKNYKIFLNFYNDYNGILEKICNENDFEIAFKNKNNNKMISSKNLDKLLEYLQNNLDFNKFIQDDNEQIISNDLKSSKKRNNK